MVAELQVATDHVVALIRSDLIQLNSSVPTSGERVEFAGLDLNGKAKQFEGRIVGARDRNTVYRVEAGHVFSVPQPQG
ncbi:MAG: hypothetical protein WDZ50_01030 [Woeseia sp.]